MALTDAQSESDGAFGIARVLATFLDPGTEAAYLASRQREHRVHAVSAALVGALAYGLAGIKDLLAFSSEQATAIVTPAMPFRIAGVVLCLACAWWLRRSTTPRPVEVLSSACLLGTLITYTGIARVEQLTLGHSDYRMVFEVFSLLAFILFPVRVAVGACLWAGMMVVLVALSWAMGASAVDTVRTLVLMFTFGVAGGVFSAATQRAHRQAFAFRVQLEGANANLSSEVKRRVAAQQELQRSQDNLEETVRVRTAELRASEQRLLRAQRLESFGQLAGGLAHDLNNMLVTIMGSAELTLLLDDLPEGARQHQQDIIRAGSRSSELARNLLTFSRRRVMEFVPLSLPQLLRSMESVLSTTAGPGVHVRLQIDDDVPPISGATGPLEQLIVNLVVNARDAMQHRGDVQLEVSSAEVEADRVAEHEHVATGTYVRLSVQDTGPGIAPEAVGQIFEPFYSTKPEGEGTGLGLSVVHGIVQQHKGFIHVDSKPDMGARFEIYLPSCTEPVAETQPSESPSAITGKETILLVDDEDLVRVMTASMLRRLGYEVEAAQSCRDALLRIERNPGAFDLVLTDVVMPGMNGHELMTQVRERGIDLPFLFASGYTAGGIHTDFVLSEGLNLLTKPYSLKELNDMVREVLTQAAATNGSAMRTESA